MKLTLVNESSVKLCYQERKHKEMKWWQRGFYNVTPPDMLNWQDNAFTIKKLLWSRIAKLNTIPVIFVYLMQTDISKPDYYLQLESGKNSDADRNILKLLKKTFGENVRISVRMEPSVKKDGVTKCSNFFQTGLKIEEEGSCSGDYVKNVNVSTLHKTRFDVTVIADISDDHELVREAIAEAKVPDSQRTNRKILEEGIASDVVIISRNGKEIKSHRNFLIATSRVFERMFENELEESKTGRVDMTDLSEHGVKAFLRHIYCDDMINPEADVNLAFELLYASHKYEVSKLESYMISYWMDIKERRIDAGVAFKTYMFVRGIPAASQLKYRMARILHRKYDELNALPDYDDLFKTASDAKEFFMDLVKISIVDVDA